MLVYCPGSRGRRNTTTRRCCGWDQAGVNDDLIVPGVRRCVRRVVLRWLAVSTDSVSGKRSLAACRARRPPSLPVCRPRSASAGSAKVAGCRRSALRRCQAATCPSKSEKRSPFCAPAPWEYVVSPGNWADRRQRCPGSCVAMPRPVVATWTIEQRMLSGTPTVALGARRWRSWRRTTG